MASSRTAQSKEDLAPPIDPKLQSKLAAKFGPELMRLGFTALPVLVQRHYRYVPGNPFPPEVVDEETGETRAFVASIIVLLRKMTGCTPGLPLRRWGYSRAAAIASA